VITSYYPLKYGIGYWVIDDLDSIFDFDSLMKEIDDCEFLDNRANVFNPFRNKFIDSLNGSLLIQDFIRKFHKEHISPDTNPSFDEFSCWTNHYTKKRDKMFSEIGLLPHIDHLDDFKQNSIACNLWITEDVEGSGTNLYKYHGEMRDGMYDFSYDRNHPLFDAYKKLRALPPKTEYINYDWELWGFELLGMAPSKYKTMTIYKSLVPHNAYIPYEVQIRNSCSFFYETDA